MSPGAAPQACRPFSRTKNLLQEQPVVRRHSFHSWLGAGLGLVIGLVGQSAHAAHPLLTDDTGTQGVGRWQLEVNTDHMQTPAAGGAGGADWARQFNTTLTRGVADDVDLAVNLPLLDNRAADAPSPATARGLGDLALQAKWRFYDSGGGWSLGVRPTLTLPTGRAGRGLGNGRATVSLFALSTLEMGGWTWLVNAGYAYNGNRVGERQQLWSASTAALYALDEQWTLVAEVGASRSADPASGRSDRFVRWGAIWRVNDKTDLDIGWRRSLSARPVSNALGVGLTLRW